MISVYLFYFSPNRKNKCDRCNVEKVPAIIQGQLQICEKCIKTVNDMTACCDKIKDDVYKNFINMIQMKSLRVALFF